MPNIKIVNIRFNLDNDERDREIHDALFQYPDGGRNQVIKEALYLYLMGGDAVDRKLASSARKPIRRVLVTRKAQPSKQNSESGNQSPPVQAETPAATAGQYAEAAANIPSSSSNQKSDGEEQVIAGLRSMIQ
jgi:hypothetical protein